MKITLFQRVGDGVLSKRITADPETGRPISDGGACRMGSGRMQTTEIADLDDLAKEISKMPSTMALALGVPKEGGEDVIAVVTAANADKKPNAKTRTLRDMHFEPGTPAFMLIDIDYKGAPTEVMEAITEKGIETILVDLVPDLRDCGWVHRKSTSSGLRNAETGVSFAKNGGDHYYIPITDGADMKRALDVIVQRMWLAGFGWIFIGDAGQQLIRCPVDSSVASPERLIFEGAPVIEAPIEQDTAARTPAVKTGGLLDTSSALPDLSAADRARYESLVTQAKMATISDALGRRKVHDKKLVEDLMQRVPGLPEETAKEQIEARHRGFLAPEIQLYLDDGRTVTVGEVIENWDDFVGLTMADPLEPSYGQCKAKVLPDRDPEGYHVIHSFAHGRGLYRLQLGLRHVEANIRAAAAEHALTVFAAAVYRSNLDAGGVTAAKRILKEAHRIGPRDADRAIKDDIARRKREREEKDRDALERTRANDRRPPLRIPDISAPLTTTFRTLDSILSKIEGPEPPMRDGRGHLCKIARRSVPGVIELQTECEREAGIEKRNAVAISIYPLMGTNAEVELERHVRWFEVVERDGATFQVDARPAGPWVNGYASWDGSECPEVIMVAELPIVVEGQRIIAPDGLEREMRAFFSIDPAISVHLPKGTATVEQAADALDFLCNEFLADVLTDLTGKAILVSSMLTMIEAPLLSERPGFIISAARRGGGKSTTAVMLGSAVYGRRPASMEWSPELEERRKSIMAALMAGLPFLVFDNMALGTVIKCTVCEKILTSAEVADRVLGRSEVVNMLSTTVLLWTGNNIHASGDMASRTLQAELEVTSTRPENREFKHPDIHAWIRVNRPRILSALYTILMVERPENEEQPKGRFKRWSDLVARPIEIASKGQLDFDEIFSSREDANTDTDSEALDLVIHTLVNEFAGKAPGKPGSMTTTFSPKELIGRVVAGGYERDPSPPGNSAFGATYTSPYGTTNFPDAHATYQYDLGVARQKRELGESFREALETVAGGARFSPHRVPASNALGTKLKKIVGRPVDYDGKTVRLRSDRNSHTKGSEYWVEVI